MEGGEPETRLPNMREVGETSAEVDADIRGYRCVSWMSLLNAGANESKVGWTPGSMVTGGAPSA
jgi:hypothetical protein